MTSTSGTATETNIPSNATSVALVAVNALRLGLCIMNDGSNNLYVKLGGGTASATSYTVKLVAGAYYEVPYGFIGAVSGIWDVATGSARITELT